MVQKRWWLLLCHCFTADRGFGELCTCDSYWMRANRSRIQLGGVLYLVAVPKAWSRTPGTMEYCRWFLTIGDQPDALVSSSHRRPTHTFGPRFRSSPQPTACDSGKSRAVGSLQVYNNNVDTHSIINFVSEESRGIGTYKISDFVAWLARLKNSNTTTLP